MINQIMKLINEAGLDANEKIEIAQKLFNATTNLDPGEEVTVSINKETKEIIIGTVNKKQLH